MGEQSNSTRPAVSYRTSVPTEPIGTVTAAEPVPAEPIGTLTPAEPVPAEPIAEPVTTPVPDADPVATANAPSADSEPAQQIHADTALRALFDTIDTDGDGTITSAEFEEALRTTSQRAMLDSMFAGSSVDLSAELRAKLPHGDIAYVLFEQIVLTSGLSEAQQNELAVEMSLCNVARLYPLLDRLPLSYVARTELKRRAAEFQYELSNNIPPPPAGPPPPLLPPKLAVMRHSVRLDMDESATWSDRIDRPYDTPISDLQLPLTQAECLAAAGHRFEMIICSPFRRCLQTAGVVAHQLGISKVRVHAGVGEKVDSIKKCQRDVWKGSRPADGKVEYLSESGQLDVLREYSDGTIQTIDRQDGSTPPPDEDYSGSVVRYAKVFTNLRDECCLRERRAILVVGHGDTVDGAVQAFTEDRCYQTDECCWVVFEFNDQTRAATVVGQSLIGMMPKF